MKADANAGSENKKSRRAYADRESGIFGGLMLTLREYRGRLKVTHGYELNKKPREVDCVIIDLLHPSEAMDNDIARGFAKHNLVEIKNSQERLSVPTVWKVISYAAQYVGDHGAGISPRDVTATIIRSSRPNKAIKELEGLGYSVKRAYPGVYHVAGMVDMRLQLVVTRELEGDAYVPLRLQMKNAAQSDYRMFAECVKERYTPEEAGYVESVVKYGIYDDVNDIYAMAKGDKAMYERLMELFKDDIDKKVAEGRAEEKARGEAERKRLEMEIAMLRERLMKYEGATA